MPQWVESQRHTVVVVCAHDCVHVCSAVHVILYFRLHNQQATKV